MKLSSAITLVCMVQSAMAFTTPKVILPNRNTQLASHPSGMDLSGNTWKPDSEKMGATDTGDYFPEGYDPNDEPAFQEGLRMGQGQGGSDRGPALPGMENLGEDAIMMGGIEDATEIPEGMDFTPSSVVDGEFTFTVPANGAGR